MIQLPVAIHRASSNKIGTLILNFGGPWIDDTQTVQNIFPYLSKGIQDHFDIVGFAPRGTGPNAISCHSDQMDQVHALEQTLNLTYLGTSSGAEQIYNTVTSERNLCQYDASYPEAKTKNTVQDLDQLRQALNIDQLDYYGASYGTRLGLAYLITYPEHVNSMVLDANVAPNNNFLKFVESSSAASDNTLQAFFSFCYAAGESCPLYQNSPQAIQATYQKLLTQAQTPKGIPTSATYSNQPFTAAMLTVLVTGDLGDSTSWMNLASELNQAVVSNNADALMNDYSSATSYIPATNTFQYFDDSAVHSAVLCADYFIPQALQDKSNWLAEMQKLHALYPLQGGLWGVFFSESCINWPGSSDPLLPQNIQPIQQGNPKVLIVNNAFDPVTPLSSAQDESQYLNSFKISNQLLTWGGAGHGSYQQNTPQNGCIDTNVDQFLLTNNFPTISTCTDQVNPFEQSVALSPRLNLNSHNHPPHRMPML